MLVQLLYGLEVFDLPEETERCVLINCDNFESIGGVNKGLPGIAMKVPFRYEDIMSYYTEEMFWFDYWIVDDNFLLELHIK